MGEGIQEISSPPHQGSRIKRRRKGRPPFCLVGGIGTERGKNFAKGISSVEDLAHTHVAAFKEVFRFPDHLTLRSVNIWVGISSACTDQVVILPSLGRRRPVTSTVVLGLEGSWESYRDAMESWLDPSYTVAYRGERILGLDFRSIAARNPRGIILVVSLPGSSLMHAKVNPLWLGQ
ncbi:hypothetical protein VNO77_42341 [Canavalia gladiata]|uniref:Uncharacterized protein n=1 Tax=Canavalia gladiata TaxID=3824 RepID=A0AAN9K0H1_CANGL